MRTKETKNSAYETCLEIALKRYADAEWLGNHSPLAQPYFLGVPPSSMSQAKQRGEALQRTILQACEAMWGSRLPLDEKTFLQQYHAANLDQNEDGQRLALALEVRYLHRVIHPRSASLAGMDYLGISTPHYHRVLRQAIGQLGENLLRSVHPPLQLERPRPPGGMYGRQSDITDLFATLRSGKSLTLCGESGVGKSSLAAAVCQYWSEGSFFWYTLRARLNDNMEGFLFAFAFFLHQHDASELWQQILADHGRIHNFKMAESMALHAIKRVRPTPLLVIDEADLLLPATLETRNEEHARLLGFLDGLSQSATLLLIGQRAVLADIQPVQLVGLNASALMEWFHILGLDVHEHEIQGLLDYTSGNPRFLTLCLALIQNGTSLQEVTKQLKGSPGVKPLISRLLNQLGEVEQQILGELAVFRQSAPADIWLDRQSALQSLSERGLIQLDLSGGASLLPIWGELILNELSPDVKATLHHEAAQVRAERGEYTEAAYHYLQAGYPEAAIQVWYPHREYILASGQTVNASSIFNSIVSHRLPKPEQQALTLIRTELARFTGEYEKGLRHLSGANWRPSRASVNAHALRGMLLTALGDNAGALREYQAGLDDAALIRQPVMLQVGRSARLRDEGEYPQAWKEIKRARFLIEQYQGELFQFQGEHEQARQAYLRAIEIARELDDKSALAQIYTGLGGIIALRNPEEGLSYLKMAADLYEKLGNQLQSQFVKINLTVALMQAGKYQDALPLAQDTTDFYLNIRHASNAADSAVNLSEIFLNLGDLDQAMRWANVSLAQEHSLTVPYALNIIGLVANQRKDFPQAENCFRTILQDKVSSRDILAYAWRGLGEMYKAQGRKDDADKAFKEALAYFDELQNPIEVQKTRDLQFS
jgi:tetratricopeptide (TPR) repeat protein